MIWRTYRFPEELWKKFEILRAELGLKKQEFFELVIKKGLEVIEKELGEKATS